MRDVWKQLGNYRKVKTLPGGGRVLLRPLAKKDKAGLVDLFARAASEDLDYFRDDAGDSAVVESWVDNLNLKRVYPLVAVADDKIVGDATLHFGKRYHRHLAWVRIFLDRAYRRQGIGTLVLRSLVEIARLLGLHQLYTEVVTTQHRVVKAFRDLGFREEVVLPDYFVSSTGETLDMMIMVLRLVEDTGEF
ncbi:MAG: GNAT family N-acetyltransferase [Anaerolineales bacterium]|nr:MAG: GNAT family N-acetyltransferase [Anaerolineales bacterium]